jgi:hypothetical protein
MQNFLHEFIELIIEEKNSSTSLKFKATAIEKACKTLGIAISSVQCYGPSSKNGEHCRVYLEDTNIPDKQKVAADIVKIAFGVSHSTVNMPGKTHSGMHQTYQVVAVPGGDVYDILFSGDLTTGARGGGYAYEDEIKEKLRNAGANLPQEGAIDTTVTDVFAITDGGTKIGIEVKAEGAKFGQPTLQFSYDDLQFYAKRTKSIETAEPVLTILNDPDTMMNSTLFDWLDSLKSAWDAIHPEREMLEWDSQVQVADWELMRRSNSFKQSGPSITINTDRIITYYLKKHAHYIQLKGKGLYAFDDVLGLGVPMLGGTASIRPEILTSGGNKVIRASLELTGLSKSSFDLDKDEDARAFAIALSKN